METLFSGYAGLVGFDADMLNVYLDKLAIFLETYLRHMLVYHSEVDEYVYPNDFAVLTGLDRLSFDSLLIEHDYERKNPLLDTFYELVFPRVLSKTFRAGSKTLEFQSSISKCGEVLKMAEFLRNHNYFGKSLSFVEIGAGKGYLSMYLAEIGEHVISVEGSLKHAFSWARRLRGIIKMEKDFPVHNISFCPALVTRDASVALLKTNALEITALESFVGSLNHNLIRVEIPNSPIEGESAPILSGKKEKINAIVVGLHACGSLSCTVLGLKPQVVAAITVPCCFSHIQEKDFFEAPQMKHIRQLILSICKEYTVEHVYQPNGSTIATVPNHLLTEDGYIEYDTYEEQIEAFSKQNSSENIAAFEIYCTARQMLGEIIEGAILVDRLLTYGAKIDFGFHGLSGKGFIEGIYDE